MRQYDRPSELSRKSPSPFSIPLKADAANNMCGRDGFNIHGDFIATPGDSSKGSIVLTRPDRERIIGSGINNLLVVDVILNAR